MVRFLLPLDLLATIEQFAPLYKFKGFSTTFLTIECLCAYGCTPDGAMANWLVSDLESEDSKNPRRLRQIAPAQPEANSLIGMHDCTVTIVKVDTNVNVTVFIFFSRLVRLALLMTIRG